MKSILLIVSLLAVSVNSWAGGFGMKLNGTELNGLALNGLSVNGVANSGLPATILAPSSNAHAEFLKTEHAWGFGTKLNGKRLNGLTLNGLTLNGKYFNGKYFNGIVINGIVINGFRLNGVANSPLEPTTLRTNNVVTIQTPLTSSVTIPVAQLELRGSRLVLVGR